jgi:hypothetical protein
MSTLTHLSDAELDAVTGGFVLAFVSVTKIAANNNMAISEQENVQALTLLTKQTNVTSATAIQTAIA